MEQEIQRMEDLWITYERQHLWSARRFEEEHPDIVPATRLEEIHGWEDFAVRKYLEITIRQEPKKALKKTIQTEMGPAEFFST